MLIDFLRKGFIYLKHPNPPTFSGKSLGKLLIVFYSVCSFEILVFLLLLLIYPDNFFFFQYFFSELGAPITIEGSQNTVGMVIFSLNMILGAIGTLSFILLIAKLFPHPQDSFYRILRYIYYCCIVLLSIGMVFVALPYTTHWIPHVLGGFTCVFAMWSAWCIFILFNTKWKLAIKLAVLIILNLFCAFIFISLLLGWYMEILQKPGQGLITLMVVIWPFIYYLQTIKKQRPN
jgi:hypothetical protein